MDGDSSSADMDVNTKTKKALLQRVHWLDQQGLPPAVVDAIVVDVKALMNMNRPEMMYYVLAMALLLGIRAEHEVAAHLLEAYRQMERTPPPKKGSQ